MSDKDEHNEENEEEEEEEGEGENEDRSQYIRNKTMNLVGLNNKLNMDIMNIEKTTTKNQSSTKQKKQTNNPQPPSSQPQIIPQTDKNFQSNSSLQKEEPSQSSPELKSSPNEMIKPYQATTTTRQATGRKGTTYETAQAWRHSQLIRMSRILTR